MPPIARSKISSETEKKRRSRLGCRNCKLKKKKCDEIKPICTSCLKQRKNCIYQTNENKPESPLDNILNTGIFGTNSLVSTQIGILKDAQNSQEIVSTFVYKDSLGLMLKKIMEHICLNPNGYNNSSSTSPTISLSDIPLEDVDLHELRELTGNNNPNSNSNNNLIDFQLDEQLIQQIFSDEMFSTCTQQQLGKLEVKLPISVAKSDLICFEYFCLSVLPEMSILPHDQNLFSKVYIPMAFQQPAMMHSLIIWGCRAMNNKGLNYLVENKIADDHMMKLGKYMTNNELLLNGENFITNFSCYMALVCMEASFGDVHEWPSHFTNCSKMINKMPNGFKYLKSCNYEAGDLLAEHFIYFDIFASQSNENGTFFPMSDYQDHFNETNLNYDPLQGCVRPITLVIGKIINLLVESSSLNSIYNDQSVIDREVFDCDKYEILTDILQRANELERDIEFAKPDMHALKVLKTSSDLEVHLTHFEAFQLSSQIYLKQVIKKLPPITLEIQMLFLNLKTIIPLLINSSLKKNLAFPLMILGISAVTKEDKEVTRSHLEHLIQNYGYSSSYQKILTVVEKVWSTNDNGTINVEWFQITRDLGWRLNLGR